MSGKPLEEERKKKEATYLGKKLTVLVHMTLNMS